jgi:hypothetical protein
MSSKTAVLVGLALVLGFGAPLARGQVLWGYYPIHENDYKDYSGNNHHGTPVDGAAIVSDGERGWVMAFNVDPAQPSRVNCGTNDPSAGGQLTVSTWLYWQGTNGNWQGIAGKSFSYTDRRWVFQLRDSDGHIQWGGADNANLHIFADVAPAVDEWQHVVGACDGKTSKVYINGQVVGSGAGGFAPGAAGANVTLGFGEDRSDYDESFNGRIDEIHILTRGLSDSQVVDLATGVLPSFDKARDPNPADGDGSVMMPLFRWTAGDGAVLHDIYLGTTPELGEPQLVGPRYGATTFFYTGTLQPGTTYFWRVDEVNMDGVTITTGDVWQFTTQALTAYRPDPPDGATDASPVPTLTWMPGQGALKHHLYFGDNPDAVAQGTADTDKGEFALADTTFAPGELQQVGTYYWRVDEIVFGGTVRTGAVWTFTTYLPIDDFESYNDEENKGTRIYETWIDGWTNNNGSTVGHTDPPFAERTIVHGGLQSMPLDYNNVDPPFYSEAERTWDTAQDWTVNDVNTLVLYVRGRPTNSPAPVYVRLEDSTKHSATVVYPEPAVVTKTKWTEWRIPLSDLTGVNISRVKTMCLGVGDRDNPAAGGKGLLYVDDIWVTK